MPFNPDPSAEEAVLCDACKALAPDKRGHTFLVPQQREDGAGYFLCLECGALWQPGSTDEGRGWALCRIEKDTAES